MNSTRWIFVVCVCASLAFGCKKKEGEPTPAAGSGSGSGSAMMGSGSATAGSGSAEAGSAGSAMAGSGSATETAGSGSAMAGSGSAEAGSAGSGSATAAAPAVDPEGSRKWNCKKTCKLAVSCKAGAHYHSAKECEQDCDRLAKDKDGRYARGSIEGAGYYTCLDKATDCAGVKKCDKK
jgi:hypothetical protein